MATVNGVVVERLGTGKPLLLMHGTGGTRFHWHPLVDRLAPHRELLLVDLPGHGESEPPPPAVPHTPIGYAQVLAGALDELGMDSVEVAGNSVGGWTALELAKLGRARSVVAIAPAGLWARHDPWSCTFKLWSQHKMGRLFGWATPRAMRSDLARSVLLGGTVARPRRMSADAAIRIARAYSATPTFDVHLAATRKSRFRDGRAIDVPVTVAWGENERLIPTKARLRDELPPHTRFVVLPNCGHLAMWDDPEGVAGLILEGSAARGSAGAP